MSGEEIIKRLNEVKEIIIRKPEEKDLHLSYIDYIIDDIFMYKNNVLWVVSFLEIAKIIKLAKKESHNQQVLEQIKKD